jgi:hypothetical protein
MVQIGPEPVRSDQYCERAVGRGDDADVDRLFPILAEAEDLPFL